ncbi:MAG: bifunctional folylpolyglutamate synthase/dihydrofolate synthase [Oscillospiraceae bacterium]|nr:bifunctional folylpolyglutamate synthase/dihydrofolate synthase [Oscillospiraceae bacterium]
MNIYEAMNYINSFSKLGAPITTTDRFRRIMDAIGNPQDRLKFIHVAGTNGKGSTVRMLASALSCAGYKTGEFTSPYIKVYNDRIRINGRNISDDELCQIVESIMPMISELDEGCSQFEITTAIAFVYYAAMKCDVVVLETGLGGLLDCTNIIKQPLASVITSISLDHTKILGDTIEQVARHKAGIIKPGCPVVLACGQKKETINVVHGTAAGVSSEFHTPDIDKLKIEKCDYTGNKFRYKGRAYVTSMIGKHQIDNALTAIETAEILRKSGFYALTYSTVYDGIKSSVVPSRCQILHADKPFVVIDGAHNPDGMRALADFVRTVPKEPRIMVCGMMEDKDWQTALGFMTRYIDYGICIDGFAPKTVFAPKLAELFRDAQVMSIKDAVPRAMALAGESGMVIIAGSLYLASAFQKMMG